MLAVTPFFPRTRGLSVPTSITLRSASHLYTGVLFVALAALCWSTAGLFTRLIALDPWTILFWRGVFGAVLTGACALCLSGGDPAALIRFRRGHWSILLWMTLGTLAFIPALALTSVASVAILYATTPLIVAGLSRIWLGERIRARTLLAGLIATAGVALMGSDGGADISSAGLALAFVMAFSMAMTTVAVRKYPGADCWQIGYLSNALTACLSASLAQPFAVTPPDLGYLLLFSLVQMTLGLGLFVMGTRRLLAADAAIIGLIEAPLAPLWVWLAFNETPSGGTMIGGAFVLAAAAGHIVVDRKCRRQGMAS
jgi:drug/metabolite transporter (DMT)-like permease